MPDSRASRLPVPFDEPTVRRAVELLFFAYRDFTGGPDARLARYGFGRAHHRVLYFVGRHPHITVSALLGILRITKQSLSRVLRQLVAEGFVGQTPGPDDRRQRQLRLTAKGAALERRLFDSQRQLLVRAFGEVGPRSVEQFFATLLAITEEKERFASEGRP